MPNVVELPLPYQQYAEALMHGVVQRTVNGVATRNLLFNYDGFPTQVKARPNSLTIWQDDGNGDCVVLHREAALELARFITSFYSE